MATTPRRARVYARGAKLWIDYTDKDGRRRRQSTGLSVGQEREAERVLAAVLRQIETDGPMPGTVRAWAERWIESRRAQGIASAGEDESRLRHHILPAFGERRLDEITVRDVRAWVEALQRKRSERTGQRLAPRTVRLIYGTLQAMMADAVGEDLIEISPCRLSRKQLPKRRDRDPEWRPRAVFGREELAALISDPRIPDDRRVAYALLGLAGLRWGEVAALRWRAYEPEAEPLGRLTIATAYNSKRKEEGTTKTEAVRPIPVHPVLAAILARWKLATGGQPDDLVIPPVDGSTSPYRTGPQALRRFREDLELLGLRQRRIHDLRRSFITLAQDDGAPREVIRQITHTAPSTDIVELYTTRGWATLCRAVECLRIEIPGPEEERARAIVGAQPGAQSGGVNEKAPQIQGLTGRKLAGDAGLEPANRHLRLVGEGRGMQVKTGGYGQNPESEPGSNRAKSGHSCAQCAPADPEAAVRAAIDGMEPRDARALLLQILTELA